MAIVAAVFIAVGWLIAERRPGNAVGPLLLAFGALFAWYLPADLYLHLPGSLPGAAFAALFISILDAPMFTLVALTLILFPDGRPPSPRWRPAIWAGLVGIGLTVVGYLLLPDPFQLFPAYRSPFGIDGFPGFALVVRVVRDHVDAAGPGGRGPHPSLAPRQPAGANPDQVGRRGQPGPRGHRDDQRGHLPTRPAERADDRPRHRRASRSSRSPWGWPSCATACTRSTGSSAGRSAMAS